MDVWMGAAVPLVVAVIGGLASEFAGGAEGRQQRKVLAYLQIAQGLGDTAEGRAALKVARDETADLVTVRGTKWHVALCAFAAAICAVIALACAIVGVQMALESGISDNWAILLAITAMVIGYVYLTYLAFAFGRIAYRRRREQRPTEIILPDRPPFDRVY